MTTLMASVARGAVSGRPSSSLEGVSRHTYAATLPPDRFYCLLDELPLHLIPQRAISSHCDFKRDRNQPLYLNPECILCVPADNCRTNWRRSPELLCGVRSARNDRMGAKPATGNLLPFWLGPRLEGVVRSLRPE